MIDDDDDDDDADGRIDCVRLELLNGRGGMN